VLIVELSGDTLGHIEEVMKRFVWILGMDHDLQYDYMGMYIQMVENILKVLEA